MSTEQPIDDHTSFEHEPELDKYFKAAIKTRASDLHLKVGQPPKLRLFGELKKTTGEVMTAKRIEELVFEILTPTQKDFFWSMGRSTSLMKWTVSIVSGQTFSASAE